MTKVIKPRRHTKFPKAAFDLDLYLQTAETAGTGEASNAGNRLHCRIKKSEAGKTLPLTFSVPGNFQEDHLSRYVKAFEVSLCVHFPVEES